MTDEIHKHPYQFICDYYEGIYKNMGREVFSTLALVIPSLILPPIPHKNAREIKPSINFLLICPPGNGKSAIAETFSNLAYNSFPFEAITDSKLYTELSKREFVTLVVSDVFKIFSNPMLSKTMENVLGDEQKISRFTQRTDNKEKKIRAVAFLSGTPNSLNSVISDGIIFRTAVCLIFHNSDEHDSIGSFVSNGVFQDREGVNIEQMIMDYYYELLQIQLGEHAKIPTITGYIVDPSFNKMIYEAWKPLVYKEVEATKFSFFREMHQGFRYMCAHAFLNIFQREVRNGQLVINEEDVKVAIKLMTKELRTKFEILSSSRVVSEEKMKNTKDLADYVERLKHKANINLSKNAKAIMGSIVQH